MFEDTEIFKLIMEAEDRASETIKGVGEHLAKIAEIGAGFTLGAIGYSAISQAVGGIEELGKSLIETNATAEQLQQTFAAIYQSGPEAQQAMGWLTQFAMTAPFTREAIQQAGVTIASLGLDITQVLPALGNLAGVMGTDMPVAAQAFMDAYEGRFQMMARDLHVNKEELVQYGLQIEKNGHVVQSTLAPAFEAFVAARYPNGMALQMETFNGQMSNLKDHLQLIERTAGGAMFKELEGSLKGVISYMNDHQSEILGFATVFGKGLAGAMHAAGEGAMWLMAAIPPTFAAIEGVWARLHAVVAGAGTGINAVQRGIGNYLGQILLPEVQTVLGFMMHFWDEHGKEVGTILSAVGTNVQRFLSFIATNVASYMGFIKGVMEVAWGAIEIVIGGALDLLSGNMDGFGATWNKGWRMIWDGATQAVEGAGEIMIRLLAGAFDAINSIEHTLYDKSQKIFGGLYELFATLEEPVIRLTHGIFQPLFDGFNAVMDAMHNLSTSAAGQFLHLPQIPALHMTMQSADAAIAAIHKTAKTETHPLGWAANVGITYDEAGALKRMRDMGQQIMGQNAADAPGTPSFTSTQAQKRGKDAFDTFIESLKDMGKGGLKLPVGVDTAALLGTGVGSLPVSSFGADGAAAAATHAKAAAAAHAAITGGPYATPAAAQQGAGEGSTIAAYGAAHNPQQETNSHLRAMVATLQKQIDLLMTLLTSSQRQQFAAELGAKAAVSTAQNTGALARMVGQPSQSHNPLAAHGLAMAGRR